eukprot:CAMPEP_0194346792 /NCGR_PEP_ID=MMETSP0171-20130528/105626_1 /TAXON_ID=218684 /ORGANISM="Corethron pennatum, Strain L29A3" /LENGTH=705 /DNA_ID=CAMNT_0039113959 /DNA_START=68 /DNA_END=2185 /DNA_ORIENTATION=+
MMGGRSLSVCALLLSGVVAGNGNGSTNRNTDRYGGTNQNANRQANRNARTLSAGQPTYYPTSEPTYMPTWMPTQGLGEMVALGDMCRNNENCHSGNCYFGPFDNQDEGICQCSFLVETSCSGGTCELGKAAGRGTPINQCVDFPNGAVCTADSDCLSRSCWLGRFGKAKVGECQCKTCVESGCSSCQTGENCPMTTNAKPKVCLEWNEIPTQSPSDVPPQMGLGRVCRSDLGCESRSCYMEEGAHRGICQCSRDSCEGGLCTSPAGGGVKECVGVPKGKVCFKDENCESSSCFRGARGTNMLGTCQCQECTERGCSVCGFRQVCKHIRPSVPNECVLSAAVVKTPPETRAPTVQQTLPPCTDTPAYVHPKFQFQWSCTQFGITGCGSKLILLGFSEEAVAEIRAHCRLSCDACDDPTAVVATGVPTAAPTVSPTVKKTRAPTEEPTPSPTDTPTSSPTDTPTSDPTEEPTSDPTRDPTATPTRAPTAELTDVPTAVPTGDPTDGPTVRATGDPVAMPLVPTGDPTDGPTAVPTGDPTDGPTARATGDPVAVPLEKPVFRRQRPPPVAVPVVKPVLKKAMPDPTDKLITGPGVTVTTCGIGASCQSGNRPRIRQKNVKNLALGARCTKHGNCRSNVCRNVCRAPVAVTYYQGYTNTNTYKATANSKDNSKDDKNKNKNKHSNSKVDKDNKNNKDKDKDKKHRLLRA